MIFDVCMVLVVIMVCGMVVVGIGGYCWMIFSVGIGCFVVGMIVVKCKVWLVVVFVVVGLIVFMSVGMCDFVVYYIGVVEFV